LTLVVLGGTIPLTPKPLLSQWATPESRGGPMTHQQAFFLVSGIEPVAPTPKEIQKLLETTPEYGI